MSILDRIQQILAAEINTNSSARRAPNADPLQWLDEDQALRDAINQAVKDAKPQPSKEISDACRVLGITAPYTSEQLKTAWRTALLKWHPDLYVRAPLTEQDHAASMTRTINTAYFFLRSQL